MAPQPQNDGPTPSSVEQYSAFTLFDLAYLLIRDGSIAGCAIAGWYFGGMFATATGAGPERAFIDRLLFVVVSIPVGQLLGWALQGVFAFALAVVFKALFGGTIWGPDR